MLIKNFISMPASIFIALLFSCLIFWSSPSWCVINEWQAIGAPTGSVITQVLVDTGNPDNIYAVTNEGDFYISTDKASSWSKIQDSQTTTSLGVIGGTPSKLLRSVTNGGVNSLLASSDYGVSWASLTNVGIPDNIICAKYISTEFDIYCSGTTNAYDISNVWKSSDSGSTWQALFADDFQVNPQTNLVGVTSFSKDFLPGIYYFIGGDGLLYKTLDGGATWIKAKNRGLKKNLAFSMVADSKVSGLVYFLAGNGLYRSANGGDSWKKSLSKVTPLDLASNENNAGEIYMAADKGVFKSINSGEKWLNIDKAHGHAYGVAIDPSNPSRLYAGTDDGVITSADSGATWTVSNEGIKHHNASSYTCDKEDANKCYLTVNSYPEFGVYLVSGTYKTIDNGIHWEKTKLSVNALSYVGGQTLIGTDVNGTLTKSDNGGLKWKALLSKAQGVATEVYVDAANPQNIYTLSFERKNYNIAFEGDHCAEKADGEITCKADVIKKMSGNIFSVKLSNNGGKSWKTLYKYAPSINSKNQQFVLPSIFARGHLAVDVYHQSKIYMCNENNAPTYANSKVYDNKGVSLRMSENAGNKWTAIPTPSGSTRCTKLAYDGGNNALYYYDQSLKALFKSMDDGKNWVSIFKDYFTNMLIDPSTSNLFISVQNVGILQSTDGGSIWTEINTGLPSLNADFLYVNRYQSQSKIMTSMGGVVYQLN